jgi:hypothetical protein
MVNLFVSFLSELHGVICLMSKKEIQYERKRKTVEHSMKTIYIYCTIILVGLFNKSIDQITRTYRNNWYSYIVIKSRIIRILVIILL